MSTSVEMKKRAEEEVLPGWRHSTGPRTEAGKRKSSMNAIKHGLRSTKVLLPTEDAAAFGEFRRAFLTELAPVGVEEAVLADSVVALHWKMVRFERAEQELLTRPVTAPAMAQPAAAGEGAVVAPAPSATPLADAIIAHGKDLALVLRYRGQALRELERVRREYRVLQETRKTAESAAAAALEAEHLAMGIQPKSAIEKMIERNQIAEERESLELYEAMKASNHPMAEEMRPAPWVFAPSWVDREEAMSMEETMAEQLERFRARLAESVKEGKVTEATAQAAEERFLENQQQFRLNGYEVTA